MSTNSVTIYALCDSRVNDVVRRVRYIGQTARNLNRRLMVHWQTATSGAREHRAVWMRSVRTAGGDVLIESLGYVPAVDADREEMAQIAKYRAIGADLTNRTAGGRGAKACIVSLETRLKMSVAASRRKASPETIQKMRAAIKTSHARPEVREKLRVWQLGQHRSLETRQKMSAARRGSGNGMSKLSWDAVRQIREKYAGGGVSLSTLAGEFGVSTPCVHRIVQMRGWVA